MRTLLLVRALLLLRVSSFRQKYKKCVSFENKTTPQLSESSTEGQSDTIFGFSWRNSVQIRAKVEVAMAGHFCGGSAPE